MPKRKNIKWTDDDKKAIIEESKRIILMNESDMSLTTILKQAQKSVLAEEKCRNINSVNGDAFQWFRDGVRVTQERIEYHPGVRKEKRKAIPAPVLSDVGSPVMSGIDSALGLLRSALNQALETKDQDDDERSEYQGVSVMGASILDLSKAVDQCQDNINNLCQLVTKGFTEIRREINAQKQMSDKIHSGVCNTLQVANTFHRELSYAVIANRNGSLPEMTQGTATATEKPSVLILGVESGHSKNHITHILEDRCKSIGFQMTSGQPKPYREWDLVVVTKKVPTYWVADVKKGNIIDPERLVIADGGADPVAQRTLQAIERWIDKNC